MFKRQTESFIDLWKSTIHDDNLATEKTTSILIVEYKRYRISYDAFMQMNEMDRVKYLERRMAEEEEGRRRKEEMVAGYLK